MAVNYIFRVRGDSGENWTTKNPVLKDREIGYDSTSHRLKVGEGGKVWNELPFLPPDVIDDLETGGSENALSAEQGKHLLELINAKPSTTATITVGTVTTGAAGSNASVTNVGTNENAKFNFVIPQGATGATGAKGATGATGAKGDKGDKGATGATGPQGPAGKAATITIGTVTTGASGSNASVTNVGTASAAKLNFVIPKGAAGSKGAKGDKGDKGATGPAGPQGPAGKDSPYANKMTYETWTFTLTNGSTLTKKVLLYTG